MKKNDSDSKHVHRVQARRAMTFVELLAVLVILGMVAGVFTISIAGRFNTSKRELAKSQMGLISGNIESYYTIKNEYPSGDMGLAVLTEPHASPSDAYYMKPDQLLDPWGNMIYIEAPARDGHPYELVSFGADGQPGGTNENEDLRSLSMRD